MTETKTEQGTRSGGVQSVERAFSLLETIAAAGGDLTLSEISQRAPLPLPTIHRLLRTLVSLGYVRQTPNRSYALGARLIHLGEVSNRQLGALARPAMQRLVAELGETANLGVLDEDKVTYVGQVASPHAMRMFTEVGQRVFLHYSSVGKAILAELEPERALTLATQAGMPTPTTHSIGTPEGLAKELELTRERGYAIDEQEQELGVRCYAVSIPAPDSRMAVSISGPTSRVDEAFAERAVPLLHDVAAEIARAMGARA